MNERHFRLYERIVAIEDSLEALGPIDKLIERIVDKGNRYLSNASSDYMGG